MLAEIMRILHVVGARPNFVKLAPVRAALARHDGVQQILIHTGQHYDHFMSDVFFRQLEIPEPDCLVGRDMDLLKTEANRVLSGKGKTGTIPPFWDGKAAERIAAIIMSRISG